MNSSTNNTLNITHIGRDIPATELTQQKNTTNSKIVPNNTNFKKKERKIINDSDEEEEEIVVKNKNSNLNNNSNKKLMRQKSDASSESEEKNDEESEDKDLETELKEMIKSLIFYKIEMPSASGSRAILSSLEQIEEKLKILKNCNSYMVITHLIIESLPKT